jgi:phage tail protein X
MNRYEDINILKTEDGKRYTKTVKYPVIEKKANDIYIVGIQGDRLDNLAYKYYKDSRYWWIIARANNLGMGDLTVPIGKQIRIPVNYINILDEYITLNS